MIEFTNYIDPLAFFITIFIGLFLSYIFISPKKIVILYPTPENVEKLQYRDKTDTCFGFTQKEVECPKDESKITRVKAQA